MAGEVLVVVVVVVTFSGEVAQDPSANRHAQTRQMPMDFFMSAVLSQTGTPRKQTGDRTKSTMITMIAGLCSNSYADPPPPGPRTQQAQSSLIRQPRLAWQVLRRRYARLDCGRPEKRGDLTGRPCSSLPA